MPSREDPISVGNGGTNVILKWSDGSETLYHFDSDGNFQYSVHYGGIQDGGGSGGTAEKDKKKDN